MAPRSGIPADGRVVKLTGLPFQATFEDLASFFGGIALSATNILLVLTEDGRRAEDAFIIFSSCAHAQKACQKHLCELDHSLRRRRLGVAVAKPAELKELQQMLAKQATTLCSSLVMMKGLPFDATFREVASFFDGLTIKRNAVVRVLLEDGSSRSGDTFVDFESAGDARLALLQCNGQVFSERTGNRFVILRQVPRAELTDYQRCDTRGVKLAPGPFETSAATLLPEHMPPASQQQAAVPEASGPAVPDSTCKPHVSDAAKPSVVMRAGHQPASHQTSYHQPTTSHPPVNYQPTTSHLPANHQPGNPQYPHQSPPLHPSPHPSHPSPSQTPALQQPAPHISAPQRTVSPTPGRQAATQPARLQPSSTQQAAAIHHTASQQIPTHQLATASMLPSHHAVQQRATASMDAHQTAPQFAQQSAKRPTAAKAPPAQPFVVHAAAHASQHQQLQPQQQSLQQQLLSTLAPHTSSGAEPRPSTATHPAATAATCTAPPSQSASPPPSHMSLPSHDLNALTAEQYAAAALASTAHSAVNTHFAVDGHAAVGTHTIIGQEEEDDLSMLLDLLSVAGRDDDGSSSGNTAAVAAAVAAGGDGRSTSTRGILPVCPPPPPMDLCCPITLALWDDPVTAGDGYIYSRAAIEMWLRGHTESPMTGLPISPVLLPCLFARNMVEKWRAAH